MHLLPFVLLPVQCSILHIPAICVCAFHQKRTGILFRIHTLTWVWMNEANRFDPIPKGYIITRTCRVHFIKLYVRHWINVRNLYRKFTSICRVNIALWTLLDPSPSSINLRNCNYCCEFNWEQNMILFVNEGRWERTLFHVFRGESVMKRVQMGRTLL